MKTAVTGAAIVAWSSAQGLRAHSGAKTQSGPDGWVKKYEEEMPKLK